MITPIAQALTTLIMQDFNTKKYKPVIIWNKTDHNAPFTSRNYVVVDNGVHSMFRGK